MPSPSPDDLARFAIPGLLRFEAGGGDLTRAVATHPAAAGELYLHGAHVTAWQPRGAEPVLFMSEASSFERGEPIRGGVPICFPWFGPKADDADAPSHGLARLRTWQLTGADADDAGVTLELAAIIEPFRATYRVAFGETLTMTLRVQNAGDEPARFEEALHTYLRVGDVKQVEVRGLEGARYLDKAEGGRHTRQGDEPIRFTGETDRVYLDTRAECAVRDPALGRTIHVTKEGSDATVVWNPWVAKSAAMPDFGDDEWPNMVCVEAANVADCGVTLSPGAAHEMVARVAVRRLAV